MVSVNTFKLFSEYCANKSQNGGTLSVTQFNELCYRSVMQLFERDYQTFLKTEEISEFLKVYLKNAVFSVPLTGEYPYPSDYQHLASLRKYYVHPKKGGMMIHIKEIKNIAWGLAQISSLEPPLLRFAKYNEFSNVIRFLPKNIGIVESDYFKTPTPSVWAYSVVNSRPVYDAANSVNFEFFQYSVNEICGIFLSLIGINLREDQLQSFAKMYAEQNKSDL